MATPNGISRKEKKKAMSEERLTALAMVSMKKRLVRESSHFSTTAIEKFANLKDRRATFLFR